ncbi:Type II secretion system (T2SS) D-like protein (GspD) [Andalucia godoyi]|uniref:Type II secretion system (T2SS) D-like protein (GspD) n=1 Tax=Andalucia godoyi TaxID=505711 RepID=A0A8K0AG81_ANDGO|nr:Type II secretion system (T2SS) D-like protein (GspD) [Andalucia godoyi]|eukprot:ANDGO_08794.mRNA.1 Type II secretion system (T2SS) D-like protein (GspD)
MFAVLYSVLTWVLARGLRLRRGTVCINERSFLCPVAAHGVAGQAVESAAGLQTVTCTALEAASVAGVRRSRWQGMRIKKHFVTQTAVRVRPSDSQFLGSFALSTELRTVQSGPLALIPFLKHWFSRTEFVLVKSAILVFLTLHVEPYRPVLALNDIAEQIED